MRRDEVTVAKSTPEFETVNKLVGCWVFLC